MTPITKTYARLRGEEGPFHTFYPTQENSFEGRLARVIQGAVLEFIDGVPDAKPQLVALHHPGCVIRPVCGKTWPDHTYLATRETRLRLEPFPEETELGELEREIQSREYALIFSQYSAELRTLYAIKMLEEGTLLDTRTGYGTAAATLAGHDRENVVRFVAKFIAYGMVRKEGLVLHLTEKAFRRHGFDQTLYDALVHRITFSR